MAQSHSIHGRLIRAGDDPGAQERRVFLDIERDEVILHDVPILSVIGWRKKPSSIVVRPEKQVTLADYVLENLRDGKTEQTFQVRVRLTVEVEDDEEDIKKFVRVFGPCVVNDSHEDCEARLRGRVEEKTARIVRGYENFYAGFRDNRRDLGEKLATFLKDDLGLTANVTVSRIGAPPRLGPETIEFVAAPKDVGKPVRTKAIITVEPDTGPDAQVEPLDPSALKIIVQRCGEDHIRDRVGLHDYYYVRENWEPQLKEALKSELGASGYRIVELRFEKMGYSPPTGTLEKHTTAEYEPVRWVHGTKLPVECRARLFIENAALYLEPNYESEIGDARELLGGEPDMQGWLDWAFQKAVRECVFEATYTDVLTNWQPPEGQGKDEEDTSYSGRIRKRIGDYARYFGLGVETILTRPEVPAFDLIDGVDGRMEGGTYELSSESDEQKVSIDLQYGYRIRDLSRIEQPLDRHPDIIAHIEEELARWTQEFCDEEENSSRRFHLHRNQFAADLKKRLEARLEEDMMADEGTATVKVFLRESDLAERYRRISRSGRQKVEFTYRPKLNRTTAQAARDLVKEEMECSFMMTVTLAPPRPPDAKEDYNDSWDTFSGRDWPELLKSNGRQPDGEIAMLVDLVSEEVERQADVIHPEYLLYQESELKRQAEERLQAIVNGYLVSEFGLNASVSAFVCENSANEELLILDNWLGNAELLEDRRAAKAAIESRRLARETRQGLEARKAQGDTDAFDALTNQRVRRLKGELTEEEDWAAPDIEEETDRLLGPATGGGADEDDGEAALVERIEALRKDYATLEPTGDAEEDEAAEKLVESKIATLTRRLDKIRSQSRQGRSIARREGHDMRFGIERRGGEPSGEGGET